jgi:hypothetical protein
MKDKIVGLFFRETLGRFFTKMPKYFKIWQLILGGLFIITLIPSLIDTSPLNDQMKSMANTGIVNIVRWAAFGAGVILKLTVQSVPSFNETGELIKTTDTVRLPFTAKEEAKIAEQ